MKNKISLELKSTIAQHGFEIICKNLNELEKENANLSVSIESTRCAGIELLSDKRKQLTKAKELLTRFIMASVYFNGKETDLIEEAEQFIKEE